MKSIKGCSCDKILKHRIAVYHNFPTCKTFFAVFLSCAGRNVLFAYRFIGCRWAVSYKISQSNMKNIMLRKAMVHKRRIILFSRGGLLYVYGAGTTGK
jgi:hypothetical protein